MYYSRSDNESLQIFASVNGNQVCDQCTQFESSKAAPVVPPGQLSRQICSVELYKKRMLSQPRIPAAVGSMCTCYTYVYGLRLRIAPHIILCSEMYIHERYIYICNIQVRQRGRHSLHLFQPSQG